MERNQSAGDGGIHPLSNYFNSNMWNVFYVYHTMVSTIIEVILLGGNLVTLVALARYRELQYQRNMLIASLSVSDLVVGLSGLTMMVLDNVSQLGPGDHWNRGLYLTGVGVFISFSHVICIALDRFVAVVYCVRDDPLLRLAY